MKHENMSAAQIQKNGPKLIYTQEIYTQMYK